MKKYLLGVFAIVLAVGFSSFKAKSFTDVTFHYVGTTFTTAAVQTLTNWTISSPSCNGFLVKPCNFTVPSDYSNGTNPVNITIDVTGTSNYVLDVKDASSLIIVSSNVTDKS